MKRVLRVVLILTSCIAPVLSAQRLERSFQAGTRVRLIVVDTVNTTTGDLRYSYPEGMIARVDDRSLVLRPDTSFAKRFAVADTLRVPVSNITYAQAFTGMKRHAVHGAIAGLVVGAAVGYLAGDSGRGAGQSCTVIGGSTFCNTTAGTADKRPTSAAMFGALGLFAGAGVGYLLRYEGWRRIDAGAR